jgi:DNA modification methylase
MAKEKLHRIDSGSEVSSALLPYCRLKYGEIWTDSVHGHRVGCLDAGSERDIQELMQSSQAALAIQDPPYNVVAGNLNSERLGRVELARYIDWSRKWVRHTYNALKDDSSLYVWLGADQNAGFQPFADFVILMREFQELRSRSFITMRNQRGYGTQKNWMAVRQELLYYVKGNPKFNVEAEYTDIPKILRGYYKKVNGSMTENLQRSKSGNIRAGNVWVDIQQVFYRMKENVPGCYAQKPLKAIERIVSASSEPNDLVMDFFAHSGTTLVACEKLERQCFTCDIDPIFAEICIRRLEHYRRTSQAGWQFESPFPEAGIGQQMQSDERIVTRQDGGAVRRTLFDHLPVGK